MTEPNQPQPLRLLLDETALAFARKWGLVQADGTIRCHRDGCPGLATLPTLLCAEHLMARRRAWR